VLVEKGVWGKWRICARWWGRGGGFPKKGRGPFVIGCAKKGGPYVRRGGLTLKRGGSGKSLRVTSLSIQWESQGKICIESKNTGLYKYREERRGPRHQNAGRFLPREKTGGKKALPIRGETSAENSHLCSSSKGPPSQTDLPPPHKKETHH